MIVKRKFYFAWHEPQEKAFLENMAKEGLKLVKLKLFKYYFETITPENRIYEADFRSFDKITEEEYLQLYEDAGWEYNAKYGGWYYFSKVEDGGVETLFNDQTSKQEKYKRLLLFLLLTGFPLYYQVLIFFPRMSASELAGFYAGFKIIVYLLLPLHAFALFKMATIYFKLTNKMKE